MSEVTSHPVPSFAWSDEHPGNTGHDFRFIDRAHAYPLEPLISLSNPLVRLGRLWAWLRAGGGYYFWAPCSLCGLYTGGHEWDLRGGHVASVPRAHNHSQGICPWCTRADRGWEE